MPELKEIKDLLGNTRRLGVLGISRATAAEDLKLEKAPPLAALRMGVEETWFVVDRTVRYLGGIIAGRKSADQLGGPIRIAQVSGEVATLGLMPWFT